MPQRFSEPKYFEKYREIKRWYYRLTDPEGENANHFSLATSHKEDFYRAFFTTCLHLKDWLEKSGIKKEDIEKHIDSSDALTVCHNLAVQTKHLEIKGISRERQRSDTREEIKGFVVIGNPNLIEPIYDVPNSADPTHYHNFEIRSGGKIYDGFKLVKECVSEWDRFLKDNGLPIPVLIEEEIFLNFKKKV